MPRPTGSRRRAHGWRGAARSCGPRRSSDPPPRSRAQPAFVAFPASSGYMGTRSTAPSTAAAHGCGCPDRPPSQNNPPKCLSALGSPAATPARVAQLPLRLCAVSHAGASSEVHKCFSHFGVICHCNIQITKFILKASTITYFSLRLKPVTKLRCGCSEYQRPHRHAYYLELKLFGFLLRTFQLKCSTLKLIQDQL